MSHTDCHYLINALHSILMLLLSELPTANLLSYIYRYVFFVVW
jgi:hypothetical protein